MVWESDCVVGTGSHRNMPRPTITDWVPLFKFQPIYSCLTQKPHHRSRGASHPRPGCTPAPANFQFSVFSSQFTIPPTRLPRHTTQPA